MNIMARITNKDGREVLIFKEGDLLEAAEDEDKKQKW